MKKKRTRASNGMGSIRLRSDGRWEARYTAPDGQQRSVYARSEREVTAKLRGALHDIDAGQWREPSRVTVAEWVEVWLRDYIPHIAPQTKTGYARHVHLHIVPVIGTMKLSALNPMHARRVISRMLDAGLSGRYARGCAVVMVSAFNAAIEAGIIRENPAIGIRTPQEARRQLHIIDREQIPAFIQAASQVKYGASAVFALLTGLRSGELRALRWADVDLDSGKLSVVRQIRDTAPTEIIPPKDGSTRVIQMPVQAVELLRAERKAQAAAKLAAGAAWSTRTIDEDIIFRMSTGAHISPTTMHTTVKAIGERIGIKDLHPHDLRHSYAVAALRSGADPKTVQHNLGHRSASMTLDVYAAYTTDAGKVSAERLSAYFETASKSAE